MKIETLLFIAKGSNVDLSTVALKIAAKHPDIFEEAAAEFINQGPGGMKPCDRDRSRSS